MYLVDTNVVSEARRGSTEAVSWLRSVDPESVHLSALTLGEIMRGIAMKHRSDATAARHLAEWLDKLRRDHATRILPVSDRIAVEWGRIAAIRSRGDIDGLIAATAIVHDLTLVTRNVADFADTEPPCWTRGRTEPDAGDVARWKGVAGRAAPAVKLSPRLIPSPPAPPPRTAAGTRPGAGR